MTEKYIDVTLPWLNPESKKLEQVHLADHVGKSNIVLAFFPAAWTGVCTKEMCTFRDEIKAFESLNATVFGISIDSPWALDMFAKDQKLNFKLLSDINKEAIRKYGVVWPDLGGIKDVARRSVFVINKNGEISYKWLSEQPGNMPNFDEIKKSLK